MKMEVMYDGEIISEKDILELSDASENEYMEYDSLGNGEGFTLPIDIKVYDINNNGYFTVTSGLKRKHMEISG